MGRLRSIGYSGVWNRGNWNIAVLDPGSWYDAEREGGRRFMVAWVKGRKKHPEASGGRNRRKRRTRLRSHVTPITVLL